MLQRTLALLRSVPASVTTIAMPTAKGAGTILAGIIGGVALVFTLVFLWAVYMAGLLWVSKHVLDYLNIAAVIAFAACILVLLPCALFRVTRKFSAYGFLISSVIFGLSTWVLAFLVTFQHWGVTGLIVGVMLAGVGIVPIGMLASAFHAVWPQVGDLALGLVFTFGARWTGAALAAGVDRDEAGVGSNSLSEPALISFAAMSYATEKWRALVRLDRIKKLQIILTASCVVFLGARAVYEALHPSRSDYDYLQLVANLNAHPLASILGALLPAVILSPLAYWMFGRILRRNAARFKVCEHCAETIKAEAKVCRYCGRDVAPARQVEVKVRQRTEDEQRQPGAHANRVEPVQAVSAADVISATYEAQSRKPWQLTKPALATSCVLGLVLFGSVGVWIARQAQAPKYEGQDFDTVARLHGFRQDIPRFDELPSIPIKPGPYEDADAAYNRGDYATAMRLIGPLAATGNAAAQNLLGNMYVNGEGIPQNYPQALKWYRLAADKGLAQAQYNLGLLYTNGSGVQQDDQAAVSWYRKAAGQGYADAQFNLGVSYAQGRGAPLNVAEAVKWYRLAADQGEVQAQYNLGVMYAQGRGLQKNYTLAHMWFNLAAKQGDQDAVKNQNLIAQLMTPAQISEAQKLAREWKSKSAGGLMYRSMSDDELKAAYSQAQPPMSDKEVGLLSDEKFGIRPPSWDSLPDVPQLRSR
jgi:TPR repeat protein